MMPYSIRHALALATLAAAAAVGFFALKAPVLRVLEANAAQALSGAGAGRELRWVLLGLLIAPWTMRFLADISVIDRWSDAKDAQ